MIDFEKGSVMGLIDVLNGMQNGPHGPRGPRGPSTSSSGGTSPITMAILGLLAYKALKSLTSQPAGAPAAPSAPAPTGAGAGGLGDILKGSLGGLLGGGAAGSVLAGGLNDLLKQLQQSGQSEVAKSWIGDGPNKSISPEDLGKALGADQINALAAHSGLSRQDLLESLSQYLPQVVDQMTPNGRLPTEQELSRSL